MKLSELIPKSLIEYIRLIGNKIQYPGRDIHTPFIYGNIHLGKNVSIGRNVYIYDGTSVGDHSYIHNGTMVVSAKIGKYCSIAYNNQIGMWEHPTNFISSSPKTYSYGNVFGFDNIWEHPKMAVIGNDVWIGSNVTVLRGVNIGDGAVIGSGAVVTKDIPDYAIAVGVPAKVIKYRFDQEIIEVMKKIKWWDMEEYQLKEFAYFFKQGSNGPKEMMKYFNEQNK